MSTEWVQRRETAVSCRPNSRSTAGATRILPLPLQAPVGRGGTLIFERRSRTERMTALWGNQYCISFFVHGDLGWRTTISKEGIHSHRKPVGTT